MSVVQVTPSTVVRVATKEDVEAAATVLTRAFLNDPALNWFGCVKKQNVAIDINSPVPGVQRTIKNLRRFQRFMVTVTMLVGGVVTLAVVPSQGDGKGDEVVGVAVWLQPGQTSNMPLGKLLKAGVWSVLKGWGIRGLKVCHRCTVNGDQPSFRPVSSAFYSTSPHLLKRHSRRPSRREIWTDSILGTCSYSW